MTGAPQLQFEHTGISRLRDSSWPLMGVATAPAMRRLTDVRSHCDALGAETARRMLDALRACIERACRGGAPDCPPRAVSVTVHRDGSLKVVDDGAPLPIGLDPVDHCDYHVRPLLEVWLTEAPGRHDGTGPGELSRLTALLVAGRCEMHIHSNGLQCAMAFEQGIRSERPYDVRALDGRRASPMTVIRTTTWRGNVFRFWPHPERLPFEATDDSLHEINELLGEWRVRFPAISFALVDRRGGSSKRSPKSPSDAYAHRALRAAPLQECLTQPVREWARAPGTARGDGVQRMVVGQPAGGLEGPEGTLRGRVGIDVMRRSGVAVLPPAGETAVYRRDAVRKRPGMYFGDTADPRTLIRLMTNLCWNVAAGPGDEERTVDVALHPRGAFTVAVDGPALPIALAADDPCALRTRPVLEILLTEDHMAAYVLSSGSLRWHNFSANSAWTVMVHVCRRFVVRVHRGRIYQLVLDRGLRTEDLFGPPGLDGRPTHPMRELGPTAWHGNEFVVQPDEDVFTPEALRIEPADVEAALTKTFWLLPSIKIAVHDWRDGTHTASPAAPSI